MEEKIEKKACQNSQMTQDINFIIIADICNKIHLIQLPFTTPNGRYNYFIFDRVVAHCIGDNESATNALK